MLRELLSAGRAKLDRLLVARYPAEPAALFRIGGAVAALADLFATRDLVDLIWGVGPGRSLVDLGHVAWATVLVLLILGWRTRWMAVISYLLTYPLILNLPHIFEYHIDYFIRGWAFFLIFLDSGKVWSVDAWLARRRGEVTADGVDRTVPKWVVVLFLFHLSLDYFDSGLRKLLDADMWPGGFGLYWPLVVRYCSTGFGRQIIEFPLLVGAMSHIVLLWELTFPLLVLWRRTRALALLAGVAFHIGIVLLLPIPYFGEFMLTLYLLFVPWDRIRELFGGRPRPVPELSDRRPSPWLRWSFVGFALFLVVAKMGHFDWTPRTVDRWTTVLSRQITSLVPHNVFMAFHFQRTGILEVEAIHPDGRTELLPLLVEEDGFPGELCRRSTRVWAYMTRISFQSPRLSEVLVRWLERERPDLCGANLYQRWVIAPTSLAGDVDVWTDAERTFLAQVRFDRDDKLCPPELFGGVSAVRPEGDSSPPGDASGGGTEEFSESTR